MHFTDAGNNWRKSADDWHKSCQDDCFAAVLLVELLCLGNIFLLEDTRIFLFEQMWTGASTKGIPYRITQNGCDENKGDGNMDIKRQKTSMIRNPVVNNRLSPGRKKPINRPDSANTTNRTPIMPTNLIKSIRSTPGIILMIV